MNDDEKLRIVDDYETLEWLHHSIQEAMEDKGSALLETLLALVEELREPHLQEDEWAFQACYNGLHHEIKDNSCIECEGNSKIEWYKRFENDGTPIA